MKIEPKIRGFICTTAHPQGCEKNVQNQCDYVLAHPINSNKKPKKVLVIGSSTGYGLASRIVCGMGYGASTLGVAFEKPSEKGRTATAGWYNSAAFEKCAQEKGVYAATLNGDAFSDALKEETIQKIKRDMGQIDLVVYSLASPRRVHPKTQTAYQSVLKPVGQDYTEKSVNPMTGEIKDVTISQATEEDIQNTIQVMGGEDWKMWMEALSQADVLAPGVITVAYSYIGPKVTYPIYREGTIGRAKDHLEHTAQEINEILKGIQGQATVSINKAVVTQSSAAIPVVPLYMSLLFKVMKEKNIHEDCIEQIHRLFKDILYAEKTPSIPEMVRVDDWEMRDDVQSDVADLWQKVTTENIETVTDILGYRSDFKRLFGFGLQGVNYEADTDPVVELPSLK